MFSACCKSLTGIHFLQDRVPDSKRDFQFPVFWVHLPFPCLVSCHTPGKYTMFFPSTCLGKLFYTSCFSHSEHFSHSHPQIPTQPSGSNSITPFCEDFLNSPARIVHFSPSSSCSMAMPLLSYL